MPAVNAIALLSIVVSYSALAAPRVGVVGIGSCHSAEFRKQVENVQLAIRQSQNAQFVDVAAFLAEQKSKNVPSLEPIDSQVTAANTRYYAANYRQALVLSERALKDLSQVTPSAKVENLTVQALVISALASRSLNKKSDTQTIFYKLLRVQPEMKLDPNTYAPTTIQEFEGVKAQVKTQNHVTLQVSAERPGIGVYVDHARVGVTPLSVSLPEGPYTLTLVEKSRTSFRKSLVLSGSHSERIAFDEEADVDLQSTLCVSLTKNDLAKLQFLSKYVKLDAVVAVKTVLSTQGQTLNMRWVQMPLLLETLKEGSVNDVANLSDVSLQHATQKWFEGESAQPRSATYLTPEMELKASQDVKQQKKLTARVLAGVFIGVGAATIISGGIVYATGANTRATLNKNINPQTGATNDAKLTNPLEAKDRQNRTWTWGLIGAGATVAATGLVTYLIWGREPSTVVSATPTPNGVQVSIQGRF